MTNDIIALEKLKEGLDTSIYASIQITCDFHRLVVASKKDASGRGFGNSFWMTIRDGTWFLVTWAPNCYRCTSDVDILGLCRDCLASSRDAMAAVNLNIIDKYTLALLSDDESETLFGGGSQD